jgi:hypothetical protein
MKAGTGRRRLSTMKQARQLVGQEIGLTAMTAEAAQKIIREQSYIVDFEPLKALAALPKLLRTSADRRRLLDLLDRVAGRIGANEKQNIILGEIRRVLAEEDTRGSATPEPIAVTLPEGKTGLRLEAMAKQRSARPARDNRRTRASS